MTSVPASPKSDRSSAPVYCTSSRRCCCQPAFAITGYFGHCRRSSNAASVQLPLASLLCWSVAPSAMALYLARAVQGVSAALFSLRRRLPAIIGHTFHHEADRNRAWAIWGGTMGLTMVLAPIISGALLATAWLAMGLLRQSADFTFCLAVAVALFMDGPGILMLDNLILPAFFSSPASMFGLTWVSSTGKRTAGTLQAPSAASSRVHSRSRPSSWSKHSTPTDARSKALSRTAFVLRCMGHVRLRQLRSGHGIAATSFSAERPRPLSSCGRLCDAAVRPHYANFSVRWTAVGSSSFHSARCSPLRLAWSGLGNVLV